MNKISIISKKVFASLFLLLGVVLFGCSNKNGKSKNEDLKIKSFDIGTYGRYASDVYTVDKDINLVCIGDSSYCDIEADFELENKNNYEIDELYFESNIYHFSVACGDNNSSMPDENNITKVKWYGEEDGTSRTNCYLEFMGDCNSENIDYYYIKLVKIRYISNKDKIKEFKPNEKNSVYIFANFIGVDLETKDGITFKVKSVNSGVDYTNMYLEDNPDIKVYIGSKLTPATNKNSNMNLCYKMTIDGIECNLKRNIRIDPSYFFTGWQNYNFEGDLCSLDLFFDLEFSEIELRRSSDTVKGIIEENNLSGHGYKVTFNELSIRYVELDIRYGDSLIMYTALNAFSDITVMYIHNYYNIIP